ncbi:MAG TPA: LysR family transcriptional regulator [Vicinamibacterales bacterium]|nr:LysR family transcriptional regulator [Vicinamibacterales bacterium]
MSIEAVDLNLILVLHHVLAEGSVVSAAARLHVTASAVSNSLARLRELLGDPLFVRSGRKVVPTPFARELAPQVTATVDRLRHILEARRDFRADACTRAFTLASADNIGILPGIAVRFARAMPRASLRIVTLDHAIASDGLASGDIDVSLALPPTMPRDIRSEAAYAERLVCAMWRRAAPPSRRLTLNQFLGARHVEVALQGKYAIDYVDRVLAPLGHQRSVALSVPQFALAAACVVGTNYITMLPASMSKGLAAALPIAVLKSPIELPVVTILQLWHARSDADPGSALLRQIIRAAGSELRPRARA